VREMFAQIGAALDGKPLDPTIVYDIRRHGPIIESRSPMFLPRSSLRKGWRSLEKIIPR
jgi:hypothetical protein